MGTNTPKAKKIWKILGENKNIAEFNKKFNFRRERFDKLSFLHNFVHTKGAKYSNNKGRSNFQTFEEDIFLEWLAAYENVIIFIITLHMLKYPISSIEFEWGAKVGIDNPFPVLEIFEINLLKEILPTNYFDEIQRIAKKDTETQELYNHIANLPDMTNVEAEEQILSLDKSMIEHGEGFINWEKLQLKWLINFTEDDAKKSLRRIEILRKWAIKNNMMKPKLDRLKEEGFFDKPISDN